MVAVGVFAVGPAIDGVPESEPGDYDLGREVAIAHHLQDGDEFAISVSELIEYGRRLFTANWTNQEGAGRPLTKGTDAPLTDRKSPLVFPRNFNRVSGPDANSCAGCHNVPFGISGGGGDIATNVFVLGQRFDFATFDTQDRVRTRGSTTELGVAAPVDAIANSRATVGMFGSGFIEMLARQMTADLQAIRDATRPGESRELHSKGVLFGTIARDKNGSWITSGVSGLGTTSLTSAGPSNPPTLIVRPFSQAGRTVSLREFTNNAFNHHHGMQSTERFGIGTDTDGDGVVNELTRADITATVIFQATMAVPGHVVRNNRTVEEAVLLGEQLFESMGCAECHRPTLPLDQRGWIFTEPNPFNPPGNLRHGDAPMLAVDLASDELPLPRLKPRNGVLHVPAYTDLRIHDMACGKSDPNIEPLDMHHPVGSHGFFKGNSRFITKKLWGAANEPPFFHHGKFTTLRDAIQGHCGEALAARRSFEELTRYQKDAVIEFLKTLQVLPPGTRHLVIDENGREKTWPPVRTGGTFALLLRSLFGDSTSESRRQTEKAPTIGAPRVDGKAAADKTVAVAPGGQDAPAADRGPAPERISAISAVRQRATSRRTNAQQGAVAPRDRNETSGAFLGRTNAGAQPSEEEQLRRAHGLAQQYLQSLLEGLKALCIDGQC